MSDLHNNIPGHTPSCGCQQHLHQADHLQPHHGYPAMPQPRKAGRYRKVLSVVLSKQLWQRLLHCVVYFAASLLVLNDLFLMLARTFVPDCFPGAKVIILEILLQSLTKIISAGG